MKTTTVSEDSEAEATAAEYDKRWQRYLQETVDSTYEIARPSLENLRPKLQHRRGTLLDIGCGTGAFTFHLDRELQGWNIFGTDPSQEMLAKARGKQENAQKDNKKNYLSFLQCASEKLPFEDNSVDVVTTLSSFHFWGNQKAALREIYRVLNPDHGVLIISDWCHDFLSCRLCSHYLRLSGYPDADWKILSLANAQELVGHFDFHMDSTASYPINFRFAKIGPKWGMMTLIARKQES
jgi:ubiquinone/menaquinone biosynthesis C-methylase UbiE